jgi:alcohol dehydrogenase class IV
VADHLAATGIARPLIVTDAGIVALDSFVEWTTSLHDAPIFAGVHGNPVAVTPGDSEAVFARAFT